jgi:hypothetical protein
MIYLQIDIKYCTMNKLSMNFQVPLRSHGVQYAEKINKMFLFSISNFNLL